MLDDGVVFLPGELRHLAVGEASQEQLGYVGGPEGAVGVSLGEPGLQGDGGHQVLVPGLTPPLPGVPDHVGGAPVEGGARLEEQVVAGAELVLSQGGGGAAQRAVLAAEGGEVGQQLLDRRHLEIQSYKKYKQSIQIFLLKTSKTPLILRFWETD